MTRSVERELRALHPDRSDRTIRNQHAVEKVLQVLWPRRADFVWLLRPQEDDTVRPRQSVCYALGALWPTSTSRFRSGHDVVRAVLAAKRASYDRRYHYGDVVLRAFAARLCELKPGAAEAMQLVRAWHRTYRHLNTLALEQRLDPSAVEELGPAAAESLAADACA